MKAILQLIPVLALALRVSAHGVITVVTGSNGVTGTGFGVLASTPRTGSTRVPFQQDSSIIRDREITAGTAGVCGRTLAGGNNDVANQLTLAVQAGLPMAAADGTVTMTLHQVNGDGAGPYTCQVSSDATGNDFKAMTIVKNVPGVASLSLAKATPFPLIAKMPAGMTCTGGPSGNACIVRCRNKAIAGPFGGCVAVTTAGSFASASSSAVAGSAIAAGSASAGGAAGAAGAASAASAASAANAAAGAAGAASAAGASAASGVVARATNDEEPSIEEAELALAEDLDRRIARSRIVGRRALVV